MQYVLRNTLMQTLGFGVLTLVWIKHRLQGYTKPNTVADENWEGRHAYVQDVVESWSRFMPDGVGFKGRDILELGPGSSLGTGALLLAHGAQSYLAVDAFRLTGNEHAAFFADAIDRFPGDLTDEDVERAKALTARRSNQFDYQVEAGFDIPKLAGGRKFDLILSCAAFEHFDDIDRTIADISKVARPGCVSLHIVDFQTHSRWIRDSDPNNIYRFPERLYRLLSFPGQPNRKRPADYKRAFEANGWTNVRVVPAVSIAENLIGPSLSGLARPFDRSDMDMAMLNGVVIATRA
ncbi:SAM-dependent methyltransferase [Rhizobium petrolearium]|uniref:class I SAM-dependent methyltransferase n=1 Tax=Neorhizobium petrolearium TaxID=515361 RepID=UPI001AE296D5|nr:class I SAM-dependent methyltransferase [Neorhizobium petrolearium]MBP1842346.1 SAM-dependent methyltransferase [Neorhizobium petrolearium]